MTTLAERLDWEAHSEAVCPRCGLTVPTGEIVQTLVGQMCERCEEIAFGVTDDDDD